jgi:hypothetical protein
MLLLDLRHRSDLADLLFDHGAALNRNFAEISRLLGKDVPVVNCVGEKRDHWCRPKCSGVRCLRPSDLVCLRSPNFLYLRASGVPAIPINLRTYLDSSGEKG